MNNTNDITIANTNTNETNVQGGGGGGGLTIVLNGAGVFIGIAVLLAALYFLLGAELFLSVLYWLALAGAAIIVTGLVVWAYHWNKRNIVAETLTLIRTGAGIGIEVQRASIEAQSQLHKAMGGITVETIRTLRSSGALDKSYPPMFGPGSIYQLPDGKTASMDFPILDVDDDEEWQ